MKYSARQAAKVVGKSTPTITRAIKRGDLSATKLEGGGFEIDAAELHRVWPPVTGDGDATGEKLHREMPNETAMLHIKLDAAKDELLEQVRAQLADALEQRDHWQRQAQARLEAPRPDPVPPLPAPAPARFGGFFKSIFGKDRS